MPTFLFRVSVFSAQRAFVSSLTSILLTPLVSALINADLVFLVQFFLSPYFVELYEKAFSPPFPLTPLLPPPFFFFFFFLFLLQATFSRFLPPCFSFPSFSRIEAFALHNLAEIGFDGRVFFMTCQTPPPPSSPFRPV